MWGGFLKVPIKVLSEEYYLRFRFKYYPENIISGSGSSTIRRILFPVPVQVLSGEYYFRFRFKYYQENIISGSGSSTIRRMLLMKSFRTTRSACSTFRLAETINFDGVYKIYCCQMAEKIANKL